MVPRWLSGEKQGRENNNIPNRLSCEPPMSDPIAFGGSHRLGASQERRFFVG